MIEYKKNHVNVYTKLIAVVNTIDRSLELYKWVKNTDPTISKEQKELMKNADKLFSLIADENLSHHKQRMIAVGEVYNDIEQDDSFDPNILDYILYEGKCMDEKKLSYFIPKRVIEKGTLTPNQIKNLNQFFRKKKS